MDKATLQERVRKAEERVEKKKRSVTKNENKLEKGKVRGEDTWIEESDLRRAKSDLKDEERKLLKWKDKLEKKEEEESFLENQVPDVVRQFLEDWKQKAYEWHIFQHEKYVEKKEEIEQEFRDTVIQFVESNSDLCERFVDENGKMKDFWKDNLLNVRTKEIEAYLKEKRLDYRAREKRKTDSFSAAVIEMDRFYNEESRLGWINEQLEKEKEAKMLDLVRRIQDVVGTIEDASNLDIGAKGELNGLIVGDAGKARVETVSAGGWNIQVFHFRTLVHPVK